MKYRKDKEQAPLMKNKSSVCKNMKLKIKFDSQPSSPLYI